MGIVRVIAVSAGLGMLLSGCESMGSALGVGKSAPDEFAIVTKAPLTVPPDYALRPPKPNETRPERLSSAERTRQLLLGDQRAAPPSNGELALLQSIDAPNVDGNIRAILAAENGGRAEKDDSLANQLIFWRVSGGQIDDSDAPLRTEDAEAWLEQRQESIDSVTGGGDVVINQRKQRILNLPGVN